MDRNRFIQPSATVRVLEKKLLDRQALDRLIEARDLEETLRFLSDSIYQNFVAKLDKPQDYEEALKKEELRVYKEMYSLCPDERVVDLLALKYHYHNLKVLVKENILQEDFKHLYIGVKDFDQNKIKEELETKKSFSDDGFSSVVNYAKEEFEKDQNPQIIDIIIDKLYFKRLLEISRELDIDLFKKYVEDLIDFTNINTLLRCQQQEKEINFLQTVLIDGGNIEKSSFINYLNAKIDENSPLFKSSRIYKWVKKGVEEYNKTNSLSTFEREKDNYVINLIKEVRMITYGPEVIFAYLIAKEIEIKNLRIILISKLNNLESSFIRERLRDIYV